MRLMWPLGSRKVSSARGRRGLAARRKIWHRDPGGVTCNRRGGGVGAGGRSDMTSGNGGDRGRRRLGLERRREDERLEPKFK